MRTRWRLILILLALATGLAAGHYRSNGSDSSGESGPSYKESVVDRGLFRTDVSATGVVKPIDHIEIKSKASGKIDYLPVEESDQAEKGCGHLPIPSDREALPHE